MGVGANIRALREKYGLTQDQLAEKLGVTRESVHRWETDKMTVRDRHVSKLIELFGIEPEDIKSEKYGLAAQLSGRASSIPANAMPVYSSAEATVPLLTLGRVHAGSLTDEEEAAHRVEVPASVCARHPRAFALVVEGNCMDRVIPEGAHVLVDPDREPRNGSIAVVETEAYRAVMRRWYRGNSTLMLAADSHEEQDDMVFGIDDGPVRVVGTVVWWQAPEEME